MKTIRARLMAALSIVLAVLFVGCGTQDSTSTVAQEGEPAVRKLAAPSDPPQLSINTASYQLISSERVSRTTFLYTYRVNVVNSGGNASNVRAVVSSSSGTTVVTDGDVNFGDVAVNGTVASLDTFTLRQDRAVPFDPAALTWSVTFDDGAGTSPASVVIDKTWIFLPGVGLTSQLTARILATDGSEMPGIVNWTSSAPDKVAVSSGGLVTGLAIGSTQIIAEFKSVKSAPTLVAVAKPAAGALLVTDAQVVAIGPPLGVIPDDPQVVGTQYEVTLQGVVAPAPGTVVLAAETAPVAGRVIASRQEASGLVLTLELRPIYELLTDYAIDWQIDLSAFPLEVIPPEGAGIAAVRANWGAAAQPQALRAIAPALELEPFQEFKCDGNIEPQLIGAPLDLSPNIGLVLKVIDEPGHQKRALQGTATLNGTVSLKLKAEFKASGKCEAKEQFKIPVTGWAGVLVVPAVRFGIGVQVDGEVIIAEAELGATGKVGLSGAMGFECGGATPECRSIDNISSVNEFMTKSSLPSRFGMHADISAQLYALAGLDLSFLLGAANAEIVDARFGPKQHFDLAFEDDQAQRKGYASKYDLKLEGVVEPGSALKEAIKLAVNDDSTSVSFKPGFSTDLSESPKGTMSVDKTNARPGEVVTFTVNLTPATTEYLLIGYNVVNVELYRKNLSGEFERFRTMSFSCGNQSSPSCLEYKWTPEAADAGENEFAAFVTTKIQTPLLEIANDTIKKVTISCFGPQGVPVPRVQAASARVAPAAAAVCADTWVGTWTGVQDGLLSVDTSATWVLDEERMADPDRPPLWVYYKAQGTANIRWLNFEGSGCSATPTTISLEPPGSSANILKVDYSTTPATFSGAGAQHVVVTVSCPDEDPVDVPTILHWFDSEGGDSVSEDGLTISGGYSIPGVSTSYLFTRP